MPGQAGAEVAPQIPLGSTQIVRSSQNPDKSRLVKPDSTNQILKTRVAAKRLEVGMRFEEHQNVGVFPISLLKPGKGLLGRDPLSDAIRPGDPSSRIHGHHPRKRDVLRISSLQPAHKGPASTACSGIPWRHLVLIRKD